MEALRLRQANRQQLRLEATDLDSLIEAEHPARAIWRVLEGLDLSRFYTSIKAVAGGPGQDATDPRILIALWLYGLSEGVNCARELDRLCQRHHAYRWVCGGVTVNYHLLSDFRSEHGAALTELFSQVLAVLMHKGLVSLKRVAQDGTRVRASAGAGSFRRAPSLRQCLAQAQAQVAALERAATGEAAPSRQHLSAAREREARVEQALKELPAVAALKKKRKSEPRVSTTDPEARVMKMADGGFRPAYNVQLCGDVESRIVVGVAVTNQGTDNQQLEPMLAQLEQRTGCLPQQVLIDGGYRDLKGVERVAARGVEVYSPLLKGNATYKLDPAEPHPEDSPVIAEYRRRMASAEGKQIYQQRAATVETLNADLKTYRGLHCLLVRGSGKVLTIALWSALTYNILRAISMGWL